MHDDLFPAESIEHLFGLESKTTVQAKRLQAASHFTQVRNRLESDVAKLTLLVPDAFARSSKRKTFIASVQKAAEGSETESSVLLPILDVVVKKTSSSARLDLFILACFSLTENHYSQIKRYGLSTIFPQLLLALPFDFSLSPDIRKIFTEITTEHISEQQNARVILSAMKAQHNVNRINNSDGSTSAFGPNTVVEAHHDADTLRQPGDSLSIPGSNMHEDSSFLSQQTPAVFQYWDAEIDALEMYEGIPHCLPSMKTSRQWLHDSTAAPFETTSAVTAMIPGDKQNDMVFIIKTDWTSGWKIVKLLKFRNTSMQTSR